MRQIPTTLVLSAICIVFAEWPSVQAWSELTPVHHFLVHTLYLAAGGLFGFQTALWSDRPSSVQSLDESGVSS